MKENITSKMEKEEIEVLREISIITGKTLSKTVRGLLKYSIGLYSQGNDKQDRLLEYVENV